MTNFKDLYNEVNSNIKSAKEFTSNAVQKDKRVFKLFNSNIKTLTTYYEYLKSLIDYPLADHHQKTQILRDLNLYSQNVDKDVLARQSIILKLYGLDIDNKEYILSLMLFFLAINSNYPIISGSEYIMDVLPPQYFDKYDFYLEQIINSKKQTITNPIFGAYVFYSNKELLCSYMDLISELDAKSSQWLKEIESDARTIIYKRINDCQPGSFKNEAILASHYYTLNSLMLEDKNGYNEIINVLICEYENKIKRITGVNAPSDNDWSKFRTFLLALSDDEKQVFLKSIGNTSANVNLFKRNRKRRSSNSILLGKEREGTATFRINQGTFRRNLLEDDKFEGCRVCQCNINDGMYLTASHIVSWKESNDQEKLDQYNGLLLCPMHDFLFDTYLISFDDNGKMFISDKVEKSDYKALNISDSHMINLCDENKKYIARHKLKFDEKNK